MPLFKRSSGLFFCLLTAAAVLLTGITATAAEEPAAVATQALIPGGQLFGVRLETDGIIVVSTAPVETQHGRISPAAAAGLKAGDIILTVNGEAPQSVEQLSQWTTEAGGRALTVEARRDGKTLTFSVTPAPDGDGHYRLGLWLRDSAAGVGTVTFIDPQTSLFGGLGHGICDGETGVLLPVRRAEVTPATVLDIQKGEKGTPGELIGALTGSEAGELYTNSYSGVFGKLTSLPEDLPAPIETGTAKTGKATIFCTLDGNGPQSYEIEIQRITKGEGSKGKNMVIKVTDPALLEKTGGIVQGMSGSPIIQNGKLVGAVTHVLVNDPTKGYGILIENMLTATNIPLAKAS
ncbi:MAG: SpoIVB peptidase [Clostridia bacterium]|nr:SpoIVB peptidase [Clostridia bacterium]